MEDKKRLLRKWETGTLAAVIASLMIAGGAVGFATSGIADTSKAPAQNLSATAVPTMPSGFSKMIERVSPAVVSIVVTEKVQKVSATSDMQVPGGMQDFLNRFFGPDWQKQMQQQQGNGHRWTPVPERPEMAAGSGFIIDPQGYIVTNNHVVQGASKIKVILSNNNTYQAKLIGRDPLTDLALVKIDAGKPLPYVSFATGPGPKVGDWVISIGNPFGLGNTVTAGIVSAHHRNIGEGPYDDFLQIDAPINKGNSGGPSFNTKGQVIGINTAIFSPTGGSVGIGFAIPASTARVIIAKLKEHGKVERGWLGVEIQPVTNGIAEGLGLKKTEGAIVAKVIPDGPAEGAGMKSGDVIMTVNGAEVNQSHSLPALVAGIKPGSTAEFGVLRNGKQEKISVKLGTRQAKMQVAEAEQPENATLGMKLSRLDKSTRQQFNIPDDAKGVLITGIDPESDAAANGLDVGDLIVQVSGKAVASPSDVEHDIKAAKKESRKTVLLLVRKENEQRFVALPIRNA